MIPEIVGRLPIIAPLEGLTEDDLTKILLEPKNAISKQYQKLFALDKVELTFDDEAIHEIAKQAIERKTGARGLRAIAENILLEAMFDVPSHKDIKSVHVTKEAVTKNKPLEITKLSEKELEEREEKKTITVVAQKEKRAS